jgi:hypothetical protein
MNRVLTLASAVLVVSGCVNDSPLYVTGFFSVDPDRSGSCQLTAGTVYQYAGSLDLSGSQNYELIATVKSELDSNLDTKADNVTLVTGMQRNTVIFDQINFTYTSAPTATIPSVTYEAESVPITIIVAPGSTQNIRLSLLGPKAFEALSKAVANAGESSNLRVRLEFAGQILSGGRIKTTPVTYPINVYRSGFVCGGGTSLCPTGGCGNVGGQDGSPLVCSTPSTDGGMPTCASGTTK